MSRSTESAKRNFLWVLLFVSAACWTDNAEIGEMPGRPTAPPEGPSEAFPITGIWHVTVSGLSIWAPSYAKDKELGMVTWKLFLEGDSLTVLEYTPRGLDVVDSDPENFPYKKMRMEGAHVDRRNRRLTFKVDRSTHLHEAHGAFEAFELQLVDEELRGEYLAHEPLGVSGTGPDYPGRIRLVRYGSLY